MQSANEIWKDIKGYEGYYQVSNQGRVRSLDRYVPCVDKTGSYQRFHKGRILKHSLNRKGYPCVCLSINQCKKRCFIHRLVADAFIPNPDKLPFINHKDHNKSNPHVTNLEWCTQLYNVQYSDRELNNYYRRKAGLTRAKTVNQYDADGNYIASYKGTGTIYRLFGIKEKETVKRCKSDKIASDGFYWRFASEEV